MSITLGVDLDAARANVHLWNLARRLPQDEELRYLGGAHPHLRYDLYAVTNERVLGLSSGHDYRIDEEFPISKVVSTYVQEDQSGHCVHVPLNDDGHWLLRPHNSVDAAGDLARAIHAAAARKRDDDPRQVLRPEDRCDTTILEQAGLDYLQIIVPRDEIEAGDLAPTLSVLAPLLQSKRTAGTFMERVTIAFDGYNDTTWELFEIPEARNYVQALDRRFPYWLYFLDKRTNSFDAIWRCFMPPHLTPEAQAEHFPRHLDPLLRNWWTPAMDSICEFVDMSERDHYSLCERYALYFQGQRDF